MKQLGTTDQNIAGLDASVSSANHDNRARVGGKIIPEGKWITTGFPPELRMQRLRQKGIIHFPNSMRDTPENVTAIEQRPLSRSKGRGAPRETLIQAVSFPALAGRNLANHTLYKKHQ